MKCHGRSILLSCPLSCCLVLAARPTFAAEKWDVGASRASGLITFDSTLSDGTWMSLDAAPDGKTIAFDLLGHIYEMPVAGGAAKALTEGGGRGTRFRATRRTAATSPTYTVTISSPSSSCTRSTLASSAC